MDAWTQQPMKSATLNSVENKVQTARELCFRSSHAGSCRPANGCSCKHGLQGVRRKRNLSCHSQEVSLGAENNSFLPLDILFLYLQNSLPTAQGLRETLVQTASEQHNGPDPCTGQGPPRGLWWLAAKHCAVQQNAVSVICVMLKPNFCLVFYLLCAVKA